jgi:SNF2 family DNA or RNA helicase
VLLLSLADESAAGANLAACNHVVFVHALLTDSAYEYTAFETQAIGRALRYGQTRTVHVHRFLVKDTLDKATFDARRAAATA